MSLAPKIAIACQGGGSHAAFAAGVLSGLLAPRFRDRYQLIALSGTSGGAMCATLVWSGLVPSGAGEAGRRQMAFWRARHLHASYRHARSRRRRCVGARFVRTVRAGGRDLAWVALRPELVIEIGYDHAAAGRIRHGGRFHRFRDDKQPEECRFEDLDEG